MNLVGQSDGVHAPLVRWAGERQDAMALDDGQTQLSFGQLQIAVQRVADALNRSRASATVLVDDRQPTLRQVVEFLGIIASGRCAAVSDPEWTDETREAVLASLNAVSSSSAACDPPGSMTPFYIGFTSGSTGIPKGFRRHHRSWTESFRVCIDTFGPAAASCILIPGRVSHSLFLFGLLMGLWTGAGVVLQERFSAGRLLDTLAQGRTPCLFAVPSQLVVALELAGRRGLAPIEGVRLILIGGARWMRERTPELQRLFPNARLIEFYGASETSFVAWMPADAEAPVTLVGRPFASVEVDIRDAQEVDEAGTRVGMIYVRSPMMFMDYVGSDDTTSALREGDWLSVRDMGWLDEQGCLHLVGRQNRMIIAQGKNLFPEELEGVLMTCPQIISASVHGLPHLVRGQQVVAIVRFKPDVSASAAALSAWCRDKLEPFKVPRLYFQCDKWPLTRSGKTDHTTLAQWLARHVDSNEKVPQWLRPMP